MKLTGKLKNQVESAPTKEEKREAIKQAGMLLSDDELDQVSGGYEGYPWNIEEYSGDWYSTGFKCPYNPGCPYFGNPCQCHQETCPWAQGKL